MREVVKVESLASRGAKGGLVIHEHLRSVVLRAKKRHLNRAALAGLGSEGIVRVGRGRGVTVRTLQSELGRHAKMSKVVGHTGSKVARLGHQAKVGRYGGIIANWARDNRVESSSVTSMREMNTQSIVLAGGSVVKEIAH